MVLKLHLVNYRTKLTPRCDSDWIPRRAFDCPLPCLDLPYHIINSYELTFARLAMSFLLSLGNAALAVKSLADKKSREGDAEPDPFMWIYIGSVVLDLSMSFIIERHAFLKRPTNGIDVMALALGVTGLLLKKAEIYIITLLRLLTAPPRLLRLRHSITRSRQLDGQMKLQRLRSFFQMNDMKTLLYPHEHNDVQEEQFASFPDELFYDLDLTAYGGSRGLFQQIPQTTEGCANRDEILWVIAAAHFLAYLELASCVEEAAFQKALKQKEKHAGVTSFFITLLALTPTAATRLQTGIDPDERDSRCFSHKELLAFLVKLGQESSMSFVVTISISASPGAADRVLATTLGGSEREVSLPREGASLHWLREQLRRSFGVDDMQPMQLLTPSLAGATAADIGAWHKLGLLMTGCEVLQEDAWLGGSNNNNNVAAASANDPFRGSASADVCLPPGSLP
ncbi:unnamed protein product [Polarella glacialis]|uniref:Uncharacterized protein n=1 Tax=Polarella glacialis TaxID=89957 RepID=A0A813GXV8_POLGL|nr:unnamed protein product [Polarella glacialis]CAE8672229.1 unnamed protein product [Polarella glacialis]